jgi:hypothetical protein
MCADNLHYGKKFLFNFLPNTRTRLHLATGNYVHNSASRLSAATRLSLCYILLRDCELKNYFEINQANSRSRIIPNEFLVNILGFIILTLFVTG